MLITLVTSLFSSMVPLISVLASLSNYGKILNFSIDKYVPWLSDHCPLHTTIDLNEPLTLEICSTLKLHTREPNFIWNERSKGTFNANLVSASIKTKFESLLISEDLGTGNKKYPFTYSG